MAFPMANTFLDLSYQRVDPMWTGVVNPRAVPTELPQGPAFEQVANEVAYRRELSTVPMQRQVKADTPSAL